MRPFDSPPAARPARLPQIDVMRLLICVSVVVLHVVGNANAQTSVSANAVVNLFHYTRQAFFFISALVLVHASRRGPGQLRRRVSVLGVPYLVWSTIYAVLGLATAYSWWAAERLPWTWFVGLLQGTDGYHMYFLLVSVEFAVVFPLFLRLLSATRGAGHRRRVEPDRVPVLGGRRRGGRRAFRRVPRLAGPAPDAGLDLARGDLRPRHRRVPGRGTRR
ncbi:MAG: acyltransferase [Actinobacteria bacterium]|nr:MAG: acyltransferase [Actinomycetota bacterium]